MDIDKEYKESQRLYILGQEKSIELLQNNIEYLKKEIQIKQELLKLDEMALKHETTFLDNYKKTL